MILDFENPNTAGEAEAMSQNEILDQIVAEREYQDDKWGTGFDDNNTINDWATYTNIYLSRGTSIGVGKTEQRLAILKAASILVAALEAFDRNNGFAPRHYD